MLVSALVSALISRRSHFLRLVGREPILWEEFLWFSSFEGGRKRGRGKKCGWEEESVGREEDFEGGAF